MVMLSVVGLGAATSTWATGAPSSLSPNLASRASCGVERWGVKTLTDTDASAVKRTPKTTSVRALRRLQPPSGLRHRARVQGVETTIYRVRVPLIEMKLEADGDVHLVIAQPGTAQTMIVEFPAAGCTRGAPAWAQWRCAPPRRLC